MDEQEPGMSESQSSPLASSAALLFAILESLPFRVYACNASVQCVMQNKVSIGDFGSLVGRLVSELPGPRDNVEQWLADWQRAAAGEIVWGEHPLELRGELRTYRYVIAPVRTRDAACATVGVDIDITDQRRAEQSLRETYQKLREREAELAHLDRLNSMGHMASELAHELSQPLYAINNFAEACLGLIDRPGELDKSELRRWLAQIGQQARRGGDLLRRITQFVRKGELHRQWIDLYQTIRDVLTILEFELARHAIEVRLQLASMPLVVDADALLIEQVLINLIRNAEDAMDSNPPSQRLLTIRSFSEPAGVGIAVSDTGPGLKPEEANHLFDSYFTTKPHGTGLGLAICRSTIEAHQGRIWANNNPGGGATFQFVFPAGDMTAHAAEKPAPSA